MTLADGSLPPPQGGEVIFQHVDPWDWLCYYFCSVGVDLFCRTFNPEHWKIPSLGKEENYQLMSFGEKMWKGEEKKGEKCKRKRKRGEINEKMKVKA
jgi:hypothetical protein